MKRVTDCCNVVFSEMRILNWTNILSLLSTIRIPTATALLRTKASQGASAMRCSQPDQTASGNGDDISCQDDSIPRRFPRIGAQFQTRISKSTGHTIRPAPDRMFVDFPYVLEKEAGERVEVEVNGMSHKFSLLRICKSQNLFEPKLEGYFDHSYIQHFGGSSTNANYLHH